MQGMGASKSRPRRSPSIRWRARTPGLALLAIFTSLLVAGCASTPVAPPIAPPVVKPPPPPPVPVAPPENPPTPGLTGKQRIKLAIELLAKGDAAHAKPEIKAFLLEQPDNDLGKSLLAQIDEDPKTLLGSQSFSYKIQPGETLSVLADRFLDDRFKFYALARYNNIAVPSQSEVGQVVQIPGVQRKTVEPHKHAARKSDEDVIQSRVEPKAPAPNPPPAPPPSASHDPARASALRGRALEAMNKGDIRQAVALLKQASSLDPDSPVIAKDLARAKRIESSVTSTH